MKCRGVGLTTHRSHGDPGGREAQYGRMTKDETRKFRQLAAENRCLKKLVADLSLDNAMLKEVVGR